MEEKLVLASSSPRRRELLSQIGLSFEVAKAYGEEVQRGNTPMEVVQNLAKDKAKEVCLRYREEGKLLCPTVFLGADTVVSFDDVILGKPADEQEAYDMILSLSGREHQVHTGVCLAKAEDDKVMYHCFAETTTVSVYPISHEEIMEYIKSKEPMDKAGAYGIQGTFAKFIKEIKGDYTNVVGLPLGRVYQELKNC
ncbi:MAG: Maf family protein [Lachnospiraceae bacterium]|nr:Maf family protein [Lachnospiraceae bacterium]